MRLASKGYTCSHMHPLPARSCTYACRYDLHTYIYLSLSLSPSVHNQNVFTYLYIYTNMMLYMYICVYIHIYTEGQLPLLQNEIGFLHVVFRWANSLATKSLSIFQGLSTTETLTTYKMQFPSCGYKMPGHPIFPS